MLARQIRSATLALAAFALATTFNVTPPAAAATLPADQSVVKCSWPECRTIKPDLAVTIWQTKKIDGKFVYFFKVQNRGSVPANNVVLYKDVQVNNWYDNFGTVTATQYNRPTPVAPGETFGVQVDCPANNTTKYCDWASLEVKVQGTPDDPNPVNDYAFNSTNSRGY
jgi:hypothetical protein